MSISIDSLHIDQYKLVTQKSTFIFVALAIILIALPLIIYISKKLGLPSKTQPPLEGSYEIIEKQDLEKIENFLKIMTTLIMGLFTLPFFLLLYSIIHESSFDKKSKFILTLLLAVTTFMFMSKIINEPEKSEFGEELFPEKPDPSTLGSIENGYLRRKNRRRLHRDIEKYDDDLIKTQQLEKELNALKRHGKAKKKPTATTQYVLVDIHYKSKPLQTKTNQLGKRQNGCILFIPNDIEPIENDVDNQK